MTDYQKYINALRKCAREHENDRTFTGHIIVADLCKDTANLLEELEQESRKGHWIKIKPYPLQMHDYECSECGYETDDNMERYCSECGADMREVEE